MVTGWTSLDDEILREAYEKLSYEDIAQMLGKTYLQVRYRAKMMGLGKPGGCMVSPDDDKRMARWRQEVFG